MSRVLHFIYYTDADAIIKKRLNDINKDNVAHIPTLQYQQNYYIPEG